ncbi:MAG: HugZ family protein [Lautropia sp.]
MQSPTGRSSPLQPVDDAARLLARRLLRATPLATLATLEPGSGWPHASLVTVATTPEGSPLLLLSSLALHRRALAADPRCSLLFVDPSRSRGVRDPLTTPRLTVYGRARPADDIAAARRRFLARHAKAARYADFADFGFLTVAIERAALNGGFARAYTLEAADLATPDAGTQAALATLEAGAVERMNADHLEAIDLMAARLAGGTGRGWRISGIDLDGCDLIRRGDCLRLPFTPPLASAAALQPRLLALIAAARSAESG